VGATISKLAVKLQADTAQFDRGMNKSSRSVNKLGKSAGGISPAMIGIGAAVAVAAAGLLALTKAIRSVNEAFERMDKAAKQAKSIGIGAQELQGFQHAASLAGVEGDQMTKALQKMQKGVGEAAMGLGQARVAFEELGISQVELSQMSPDEQFLKISGAIAKIEDPAKRAAMATQIFGKAGADLLPLINQGSEAIAAQVAEMERLQGPMSDIDFTNIEDANDAATRFGLTVEGVWNQLAAAIAPAKEIVFDTLTEAGSSLANFISENKEEITAFFVGIAEKIKVAIEAVSRLVKTFWNIGKSIVDANSKFEDWTESITGIRIGVDELLSPARMFSTIWKKITGADEVDKLSEQIDKWNEKIAEQQKAIDELETGMARIRGAAITDDAAAEPEAVLTYEQLLTQADELKSKNAEVISEASRLTEQLKEQVALGDEATMTKEEQEKVQQRINELEAEANKTKQEHLETSKKINKEQQKMQKRADKLVEGLKTQAEKYQDQLEEIRKLKQEGMLTEEQATQLTQQVNAKIQSDVDKVVKAQADAAAKAEKERVASWEKAADDAAKKSTTSLVRFGSKEMYEQIAKSQFKKDTPLARFQKKSNKLQTDQLTTLRSIDRKINSGGSGGGGGGGSGGGGGGGSDPKFETIGLDDV
jgi:hypothetical protein